MVCMIERFPKRKDISQDLYTIHFRHKFKGFAPFVFVIEIHIFL